MCENNGFLNFKYCDFVLFILGVVNYSRYFIKLSCGFCCLINCFIIVILRDKFLGLFSLFVLLLLFLNVMLLVFKIDEICEVVYNVNFDFVCIIELWFKDYIDNNSVVILGYNVICWD